ncbi:MAG: YhbY family RNA-binding protein [Candidatus Woesearchaeota archaeon]
MDYHDLIRIENKILPTVRIGKHGLTLAIINDVKKQLDLKGLVKVKVLKNFYGEFCEAEEKRKILKDLAEKLKESTKSEIVCIKGNTILLYNKAAKQFKPTFKGI